MKIHTFTSTGEAYDACQTDDTIKSGDTLLIPDENVVGLAWTWPVAVTVDNGALHTAFSEPARIRSLMRDAGWSAEMVGAAVRIAVENDCPVRPEFCLEENA